MSPKHVYIEEFKLLRQQSLESQEAPLLDDGDDPRLTSNTRPPCDPQLPSFDSTLSSLRRVRWSRNLLGAVQRLRNSHAGSRSRRPRRHALTGWLRFLSYTFTAVLLAAVVVTTVFFPSYTKLPPHYHDLLRLIESSSKPGRGNLLQEKIFIAASIYDQDGGLAGGAWGQNVLDLVHLLGPQNVHLSIYENDAGLKAARALRDLEEKVECEHSIVFEDHLGLDTVPPVKLPGGPDRVKRIAYLAEVRNRALRPMETSNVTWDKLLYLNDVIFNPVDAVQLLFSTKIDASGHTDYRAACAVDFINPFKFYDTFATRDLEGYSMGVPFFPWFSSAGNAQSRHQVIDGNDAVQVRSCWGGMVAFDAQFFQRANTEDNELYTTAGQTFQNSSTGLRFRAEKDLDWDASECCLINADLQRPDSDNTSIYMNPYVRVAYDVRTLSWLNFTRRFERLYSPIQNLVNILVALPHENPRRAERAFESVSRMVWVPDESVGASGSFQLQMRTASGSGFCGIDGLELLKENPEPGERKWEYLPVPS